MILWFVLALMTAAAMAAVLWPLGRPGSGPGGSDTEVYRDQLGEITRDRSTGLIGEAEAEAAKVEVSRRLIAAADAAKAEAPASDKSHILRRRWTAIAAFTLLPAGAVALYVSLGSPELPGAPLAERMATEVAENRSIEALVARVESYIESNPNDGRGWEVLAPVYMRLGRFDDAVIAWRNTIRLNGSSASREADYGEALTNAANGVVTSEAKAAFERALALDKEDVMANFYLGMAADQDGRRAEADAIWQALIARAPPGAPWLELVRNAMARTTTAAPSATAAAPPGPSAGDMAGAPQIAPDQHDQMVAGMVARLAERLKQNGSDVEGWLRLVRSYRVLGQNDKAQAAVADAGRVLAGEPDKLNDFNKRVAAGDAPPLAAPLPAQSPVARAPVPSVPTLSAAGPSAPGPSAADVNAAGSMSDKDRNAMIGSMVARLADRLKENANDIDGWQRLLRAYMVLGERDKAQAAAGNARRAFTSDPDKLRQIDETIKSLGLES